MKNKHYLIYLFAGLFIIGLVWIGDYVTREGKSIFNCQIYKTKNHQVESIKGFHYQYYKRKAFTREYFFSYSECLPCSEAITDDEKFICFGK